MKKMKLNGKLSLNKETIAKLNDNQMNGVKGGVLSISLNCSHLQNTCGPCGDNDKPITKGLFCSDGYDGGDPTDSNDGTSDSNN